MSVHRHRRRDKLKGMSSPHPQLPALASRTLTSGLAARTLINLNFIKQSPTDAVHPVTQVVNSLLSLLVFPVEKEQAFFEPFAAIKLSSSSVQTTLAANNISLNTLQIIQFGSCKNLRRFFVRLRNAITHKRLEFNGDVDSKDLEKVTITLKDRPSKKASDDWHIQMNVADLNSLACFVAQKIIQQEL